MAKRPTVYDVAALANVSTATVSFTYSKPARVKPETRELVLEAAKTLATFRVRAQGASRPGAPACSAFTQATSFSMTPGLIASRLPVVLRPEAMLYPHGHSVTLT